MEELRKERYPPTNTQGVSDTSPELMEILNRLESIERENQQLKGESQQSRDEYRNIGNELRDAITKVQGASEEQGCRLERVQYSVNQA